MLLTVTLNPCLDRALFTDRVRLGEFHRGLETLSLTGGKGNNCARMASKLGLPVRPLTLCGGEVGRITERLLRERDRLDPICVWTRSETRIIFTVRENESGRFTSFAERSQSVEPDEKEALYSAYRQALDEASMVALGGSVSCPALDQTLADFIELARERGVPSLLDSHGKAFRLGLKARPFLAKPNLAEAEELMGRPLPAEADRWQAVERMREMGIEVVILTLGAQGVLADWAGERWRARPPQVVEINATGSGDCLLAGLAVGILQGTAPEQTLRLAMAAGAANAAVWEAAGCTRQQVDALLDQVQLEPA